MSQQIAFLGLGLMGGPMAANLARQGYQVMAWNRTRDRPGVAIAKKDGAIIVNSIAEAVANAEIIFTCVGDVPDVKEVLLAEQGVINYARPHSLIVDMSTIGSNAAREINTELQKKQLRFMDAPVSGGDIGAIKGTLTIMVGGDPEDFAECKPLLEVMGKNIHLCGSVGSGQGVKMCNQVLAALTMVGLSEAMQMAKSQGLDPNLIVEVCGTGAAGSWALSNLGPKIIEADYDPGFAIAHIIKDLRLVQEMNQATGGQIPGVELADKLFKIVQSMDDGAGGQQGTQAMIRAYQESQS
ncbi:beta-hydroxyacid dehydrogenase, 3-hydroxyisobutyrate dehydrogenase [Xenococcus sp. PCC 7305]|uniref:NAD(P)-dependent oxidoreductase n=1 Tax=Xenococcus sp. PCC 7305 TaxID=102125 RepID=UPI0002ABB6A4|nr:NAD(P)-dependent oxidoreductase [Xenococcus sp. PCC 7305]ELS04624.1 beta-hydroxyacid dehydrogenase, 3-hydroxyisobutyrate dehydrogenase [Xenococcus sp. PCC 7305]